MQALAVKARQSQALPLTFLELLLWNFLLAVHRLFVYLCNSAELDLLHGQGFRCRGHPLVKQSITAPLHCFNSCTMYRMNMCSYVVKVTTQLPMQTLMFS